MHSAKRLQVVTPTLKVVGQPTQLCSQQATEPFQCWLNNDGAVYMAFFRESNGYRLHFPNLADFVVSDDGLHVTLFPREGLSDGTMQHLWLNQVCPLALTRQGHLVLHGSAVEIGECAVAFLGDSGVGKSTLAASFAVTGTRFLTDDGLVLLPESDQWLVTPSHPSLRLWRDSTEALIADDAARADAVTFTDKARFLAGSNMSFCGDSRPLRAIYVLGDEDGTEAQATPLRSTESLLACVQNSFLLDVGAREALAQQFESLSELTTRVPCFNLTYPRRYEELPRVRGFIEQHVSTQNNVASATA